MGRAIRAPGLLRQAGISAICIFAGYGAMYGILIRGVFNAAISEDPFLRQVLGDILVQLICGLPTLVPAAFILASLVLLVQNRRKLSERTTRRINAIASFIIGAVAFFPCQFMLMMGAAL